MTADGLSPTPEGKLIRAARQSVRPRLSIRAAAGRLGISPEHWGNIERGYKSAGANSDPSPVEADASLLAKMAGIVGISADRMESEGKRPDAAKVIRSESESQLSILRAIPAVRGYRKALDMERELGLPLRDVIEEDIWALPLDDERKLDLIAGVRWRLDRDRTRSTGLHPGASALEVL